eukprot:6203393-Pleurochrysis_carterae.AAC.2
MAATPATSTHAATSSVLSSCARGTATPSIIHVDSSTADLECKCLDEKPKNSGCSLDGAAGARERACDW